MLAYHYVFIVVSVSILGLGAKFILFLGQPTLDFSVILVSLLVGSGMGSFFSDRFKAESIIRRLSSALFFSGVLLVILAAALPFVFEKFWVRTF